jgi:sRNA-binding protein
VSTTAAGAPGLAIVVSTRLVLALDGAPAETVDAEAKDLAAKQLARLAAREAAKKAAKPTAPTVAKPTTAARPTETPEQLRNRVRAALIAGGRAVDSNVIELMRAAD